MQRGACKVLNEAHLNSIASKARLHNRECGYLWRRADTTSKWLGTKWYALYQNLLFGYENVNSTKASSVILLESAYCQRIVSNVMNTKEGEIKLFCFSISFSKDGKSSMEFGAETEAECEQWILSILNCSYNKQTSLNADLNEKYVHLSQLYETECVAKWQSATHIEHLAGEIKKLTEELNKSKREYKQLVSKTLSQEESIDLKRITKVQSLCRGWLYRKRWTRIVTDYIESPDATNLRQRNRLVFELVEKEGEYTSQLEKLVTNFLIPFRMAACSSKPAITHEEINCIFLNSEILLLLHQIFYKGLLKKLDKWPSLFVGDLFDFLLPVLAIYQEYVRNHHYSLQILTELKSKSIEFRKLLKRAEEKVNNDGRSLDVILTYPMHQIPRYIIVLHQLIQHTSLMSTSELKSLENAKDKLEELSKTMRDEVSETENIRCNLAIEKLIVEGCECLLDSNQVFIKKGLLIVLTSLKASKREEKKRNVVKCFLFTNHLVVTKRTSNGKLSLFKPFASIPLGECRLVEDVESTCIEEEPVSNDEYSQSSIMTLESTSYFSKSRDQESKFQLIQTSSSSSTRSITFIASSSMEKQSWCSDISQCLDNLSISKVLQNTNKSTICMPSNMDQRPINDMKLFKDEADVQYCKAFNSCKIPQIRYATKEKLHERLVDLRFLSIDFLNTFLLTYRVFTNGLEILDYLRQFYQSSQRNSVDLDSNEPQTNYHLMALSNELQRRVSIIPPKRQMPAISEEPTTSGHSRNKPSQCQPNNGTEKANKIASWTGDQAPIATSECSSASSRSLSSLSSSDSTQTIRSEITNFVKSATSLNGTDGLSVATSPATRARKPFGQELKDQERLTSELLDNASANAQKIKHGSRASSLNDSISSVSNTATLFAFRDGNAKRDRQQEAPTLADERASETSSTVSRYSQPCQLATASKKMQADKVQKNSQVNFYAGVIVTSSRTSRRRTSNTDAAKLFAVATSGSSNKETKQQVDDSGNGAPQKRVSSLNGMSQTITNSSPLTPNRTSNRSASLEHQNSGPLKPDQLLVSTAASMRVLNILRHWIAKQPFDFVGSSKLREEALSLVHTMLGETHMSETEKKAAESIIKQLSAPFEDMTTQLKLLLTPPAVACRTSFSELSVSEIAEQMTYMDYQIFCSISSQELLGQAWMSPEKDGKGRNVFLFSKRFNEISQLVVSEILNSQDLAERVSKLEKWTTIANICRFLKNFNGVLQIMSAFASSSVFRLKNTWAQLSKHSQQTIDVLQDLASSNGRFRNMRDAMHQCDPPIIPYLGMYLMDLVFIEESNPDTKDHKLVNFSKLRMVSHIIRELRAFQHSQYTIHYNKQVCDYLLDPSKLLSQDEAWKRSLELEPKEDLVVKKRKNTIMPTIIADESLC